MMKPAKTIALLAVLAATISCGGNVNTPNLLTVSGKWSFALTSSVEGQANYTGIAQLTQVNNTVTGKMVLNNAPCATTATITGAVNGYNVTFQITEGGQVVTLIGTVNSVFESMSGTYSAPATGCLSGDSGSWSAGG
ncbi:MAG TPA: hypothetical protein VF753_17770 [Terriglobales bacterium]